MMSMKFVVVFAMLFAFVASTPLDGLQCLVIFNNAEILKQEIDSATITLTKAGLTSAALLATGCATAVVALSPLIVILSSLAGVGLALVACALFAAELSYFILLLGVLSFALGKLIESGGLNGTLWCAIIVAALNFFIES